MSDKYMVELQHIANRLEQHNGLKLVDAVPSLLEILGVNSLILKSLNINSLIQIGCYVLEENTITLKERDNFISQLVLRLMSSEVNEDKENTAMKCVFLLAVWCKKDKISIPLRLSERLAKDWELHIHQVLLDLIRKCHDIDSSEREQTLHKSFASPHMIVFLNICRHSPFLFQAVVTTLANCFIYKKGCSAIGYMIREFVKAVELYSYEELKCLFPPKYKILVSYLQVNPETSSNFCDHETNVNVESDKLTLNDVNQIKVLEYIITAFRDDKYGAVTLVCCFPLWLPYLVKYYSEQYGTSFFRDFNF